MEVLQLVNKMGFTIKVVEKDFGWNNLKKTINKMKGVKLKVGLFGNGGTPEGNLAYRGIIQEAGARIVVTDKMRKFLHIIGIHLKPTTKYIIIPKRPFTAGCFDNNKQNIFGLIERWYGDLVDGKLNLKQFLDKIGVMHVSQIQKSIRNGGWSANHPATINEKGSSRPLIDKGEMIQGVKYKIEWKGL